MNRRALVFVLSDAETDVTDPAAPLKAILKVKAPGYVPDSVHVRTRIDPWIMTVDLRAGDIAAVRSDPQVESLSEAEPLPLISPRPAEKPAD